MHPINKKQILIIYCISILTLTLALAEPLVWVEYSNSSSTVSSVWNTNGGDIYYSDGSVSIGTTSASSLLQIHATTNAPYTDWGKQLRISDDGTYGGAIRYQNADDDKVVATGQFGKGYDTEQWKDGFFIYTTDGLWTMAMAQDGRTGLGAGASSSLPSGTTLGGANMLGVNGNIISVGGSLIAKNSYTSPWARSISAQVQGDGTIMTTIGTVGNGSVLKYGYITTKDSSAAYLDPAIAIDIDHNVGIGITSPTSKLVVVGDVNVTGNITGNQIYGGMWYHNDTGTELNFAVQDTWYPLFFTNATDLNGFSYVGGFGLSSNLTAQVSGKYQTSYMGIGSGQNNHVYLTTILIDGVEKPECGNRHKMAAGGDVITQSGICIITINKGQTVQIVTQDMGGTGIGYYYGGNINLVRIGDSE